MTQTRLSKVQSEYAVALARWDVGRTAEKRSLEAFVKRLRSDIRAAVEDVQQDMYALYVKTFAERA